MILVRKGGFGSAADEHEVDWPASWRLPGPGDAVHAANDWGGFCEYTDFWPLERLARVYLR